MIDNDAGLKNQTKKSGRKPAPVLSKIDEQAPVQHDSPSSGYLIARLAAYVHNYRIGHVYYPEARFSDSQAQVNILVVHEKIFIH